MIQAFKEIRKSSVFLSRLNFGTNALERATARDFIKFPNFISEEEELSLFQELDKEFKRLKYENSHWDYAITHFREIERLKFSENNDFIRTRLGDKLIECSPPGIKLNSHTHILDLDSDGVISPHIDSVKSQEDEEVRKVVIRKSRQKLSDCGINRVKDCPLLLKIFYSPYGKHESLRNYTRGQLPKNSIDFHTWPNATLGELAGEIRFHCSEARLRGSKLHFVLVYISHRGVFKRKPLGCVVTGVNNDQTDFNARKRAFPSDKDDRRNILLTRYDDSDLRLNSKNFLVGDYIDVAVTPPAFNKNRQRDRRNGRPNEHESLENDNHINNNNKRFSDRSPLKRRLSRSSSQ